MPAMRSMSSVDSSSMISRASSYVMIPCSLFCSSITGRTIRSYLENIRAASSWSAVASIVRSHGR